MDQIQSFMLFSIAMLLIFSIETHAKPKCLSGIACTMRAKLLFAIIFMIMTMMFWIVLANIYDNI